MNYRVSVFGFLYLAREEAPGNNIFLPKYLPYVFRQHGIVGPIDGFKMGSYKYRGFRRRSRENHIVRRERWRRVGFYAYVKPALE